jgi:hypothetical protein
LTVSEVPNAEYIFYAGCNVYIQPDKILNALDIIGRITDDCTFVPGLDFCCGNAHYYFGAIDKETV